MGAGGHSAGEGAAGQGPVPAPSAAPDRRALGAILYDGATRDFVLDSKGHYKTLHYVDQRVALKLIIREGDVAGAPTIGSRLRRITRGSPDRLKTAAEDAVRMALASELRDREIELLSVDVQTPSRGKFLVTVRYKNLLLPTDEDARSIALT